VRLPVAAPEVLALAHCTVPVLVRDWLPVAAPEGAPWLLARAVSEGAALAALDWEAEDEEDTLATATVRVGLEALEALALALAQEALALTLPLGVPVAVFSWALGLSVAGPALTESVAALALQEALPAELGLAVALAGEEGEALALAEALGVAEAVLSAQLPVAAALLLGCALPVLPELALPLPVAVCVTEKVLHLVTVPLGAGERLEERVPLTLAAALAE
jgi:hypothetical protein